MAVATAPPRPTTDPYAWADPPLRARLLNDPAGLLRERGVNPPPDLPRAVLDELLRIHFLLWADGRVVPVSQFRIDPADEGLLFGRGVWESTRTTNGVPWLWEAHAARMLRTAAGLGISLPAERLPDAAAVTRFVRTLTRTQDVTVRVNATAGPPGRPGVVWMTASLPPAPCRGVRLQTRPTPLQADQPHLSGKTFHYAYRLSGGQEAHRAGFDSALVLDPAGNVLEASHANVFLRFADGWATPSAAGGFLLPGTVRAHLLAHAPLPIREEVIPAARLGEVQEAFVTNSNVGIVPVRGIDERALPAGADTAFLKAWLDTPG